LKRRDLKKGEMRIKNKFTFQVSNNNFGEIIYNWAADLFPLNRSLTGKGNRETLNYLKNILPDLNIKSFKTGDKVFDWIVPEEWELINAYIEDEFGNKILDINDSNLHIVGYSISVDKWIDLEELKKYLFTREDLPEAIPYVTSYYNKNWGFCMSDNNLKNLKDILYHVVIQSRHFHGEMNYGELILKGKSTKEVLVSTYICHPSMANNELSGIVITAAIAKWLSDYDRFYTYRILFIPETIGSIAYLSKHLDEMKLNTIAGFVLTCVGDNNNFSFLKTRRKNTYADLLVEYAFSRYIKNYTQYDFKERGSDERQYCSPLVDLPVVSIMRSKYGTYKEYHTSLDNMSFISPEGLKGSFEIISKILEINEKNYIPIPLIICEPQLGKRNLYFTSSNESPDLISNFLAHIDGQLTILDLSIELDVDFFDLYIVSEKMYSNHLIGKI
jgi:aminopeptidase-like protein